MSEQENRDALERLVRAFQERDVEALADLVHDDLVEEYPQSGSYNTAITELEDGKVKRARQYFATSFHAPQWRAQWVERM